MGTLYGSLILFLYMRDINNFILEKLRINKDSKPEKIEKNINIITDLYEVGDKCLLITNKGIGRGEKIYIDVVQIIQKSKQLHIIDKKNLQVVLNAVNLLKMTL